MAVMFRCSPYSVAPPRFRGLAIVFNQVWYVQYYANIVRKQLKNLSFLCLWIKQIALACKGKVCVLLY